ncbi:MAG: hypothetical protein EPO22_11340 [Dehalococcoidia bacterium]|nr:MAG: hypothetical protein EPO22_11340 [Dehalococcoidia bacterium]
MTERWDTDDETEDEFGPGSPDYDLSEARGYGWEPERPSRWPPPQWLVVAISLLLAAALVVPAVLVLLRS